MTVCVDAQVLSGCEKGGQLPPGGRDGPQAPLQSAHSVQGPQVRGRQPLQKCAAIALRGRRPETRRLFDGAVLLKSKGTRLLFPLWVTYVRFSCAGLLPELPDSAGQKLPPAGPETGVSAHPDGEQQVSQTGETHRDLRCIKQVEPHDVTYCAFLNDSHNKFCGRMDGFLNLLDLFYITI